MGSPAPLLSYRVERDDPVFSTRVVHAFLGRMIQLGKDPSEIVRRSGLAPDAARVPEVSIHLTALYELADAVAEAIGDPNLGITSAAAAPRGFYGVLEYIVRTAPTLEEAWSAFMRYSVLANERARFDVQVTGDRLVYEHGMPGYPLCMGRHANEFGICIMMGIARQLTGRDLIPDRVWFAHPEPPQPSPLDSLFDGRIEYGREVNGFAIDAGILKLPIVTADPALRQLLNGQAEAERTIRAPIDIVASVREQIGSELQEGGTCLESVARRLHMSGRTLQRRLWDRGTSFLEVTDDVRRMRARALLDDRRLGLSEVAFLLGYSDICVFNRAFKRWTGRTPGEYREG